MDTLGFHWSGWCLFFITGCRIDIPNPGEQDPDEETIQLTQAEQLVQQTARLIRVHFQNLETGSLREGIVDANLIDQRFEDTLIGQ